MNVLPGTVMMPDMTSLNVVSQVTSQPFILYRGLVVPRDHTYSFVVHGEITRDVATDAVNSIESLIQANIVGATSENSILNNVAWVDSFSNKCDDKFQFLGISASVSKLEYSFGELG